MSRVTPRFIPPQLATSVDQPPEGANWIHEIKHDGYRCQVLLEAGRARVLTRTGLDWSEHFPAIVNAAVKLDCQSAIIDGEAIIQDENGISDFEALRSALWRCPHAIILYAFDLMHLNGRDLRQEPLLERRWLLQGLLGKDDESRIQFSEEFHFPPPRQLVPPLRMRARSCGLSGLVIRDNRLRRK